MTDFVEQQREAAAIRADIRKAHEIIKDAKDRYTKAKLKARSKKQAEDPELLFADLADYESPTDIQDAYGYAVISDAERERLLNLWEMRENHAKNGKKFQDRVLDMLEKATSRIGDEYQDFLYDADDAARENEKNQQGRWPVFGKGE